MLPLEHSGMIKNEYHRHKSFSSWISWQEQLLLPYMRFVGALHSFDKYLMQPSRLIPTVSKLLELQRYYHALHDRYWPSHKGTHCSGWSERAISVRFNISHWFSFTPSACSRRCPMLMDSAAAPTSKALFQSQPIMLAAANINMKILPAARASQRELQRVKNPPFVDPASLSSFFNTKISLPELL